jgi:CRP-like cAMP-binding protein
MEVAMREALCRSELFAGIEPDLQAKLFAIAHQRSLPKGDYLFMLGDHADRLYVVLTGKVEICFPLALAGAVKDVAVETIDPGGALGLSALVKPYRFTLSARAAEGSTLAAFVRSELLRVLECDSRLGYAFMSRLAELLGRRFLTMQTLWGRELQRSLSAAHVVAARGATSDA